MPSYLTPEIFKNYNQPKNRLEIEKWTNFGEAKNNLCGDEIKIYLNVIDDTVKNASFTGSGCILTIVSSDQLIESIKNQKISKIHPDINDWLKRFDNIPKARENCITLSILALNQALIR